MKDVRTTAATQLRAGEQLLPLSVAQRGLWVASKLAPPEIVFNIAEAVEIHGAVEIAVFESAMRALADEIEPSRTRLIEEVSGPSQTIAPRSSQAIAPCFEGSCPFLDLAAEPDPFGAAMAWMRDELARPLDFGRDVLWKSALLRLGPDRFVWYHRCHHVVMDGYSGGLIAKRLAELYNAMLAGEAPPPSGFGRLEQLLAEEVAYRASERHERDRAYWMEQLAGLPPPVSLARSPRRLGTGPLVRHTASLPQATASRLSELARAASSSLPQILISLFAAYVHRVTGAADLALGMPVTGRVGRVQRTTPAMMANAVVMRFRFAPGDTLHALMAQAGRAMRAALRHQQFRYEDLRRALGFFHTDQQVTWTGVNIEPFDFDLRFGGHPSTAHNLSNGPVEDLTMFVYDRHDGRGLRIDFDANALLYTGAELARHASRLVRLIDAIAAEPDRPLADFPLLGPGEREVVLSIAGPTLAVGPEADPLACLERLARSQPDATAVRGENGFLTFDALRREVRLIADGLAARGIGEGDLVALLPERDAEMVAILLGVLAAGAAFLPLDPEGPEERARLILAQARPRALLATGEAASRLGLEVAERLGATTFSTLDAAGAAPGEAARAPGTGVPPGTAYVIYTSGSTGRPKGVVVPRSALVNHLAGMGEIVRLGRRDRLLAVTTLGFDIAILELLLPIAHGGQVVIATRPQVLDPRALASLIHENGVTVMQATPSLWSVILAGGQSEALRGLTLLSGGEPLPGHLARRLHALGSRLLNLYGPTETTIWSTAQAIGPGDLAAPPIGLPLANQRVYVVDEAMEPAPIGVVGELCIAGAGLASGYLGQPGLTAERFRPDPFSDEPDAVLYRTGDRAVVTEDRRIAHLGRLDDQVKVRGVRIEPAETEAALLAQDGVRQAAAVLRQEGEDARLCGYLVMEEGRVPDYEAIRRVLLRSLPEPAIPTAWATLDALPLNANGKLDKRALPSPGYARRAGYVAPRTEDERILAELWSDLFGIGRVGVYDNFFALGGDSLIAAQMIAELSDRHGAELPLGAMFEDASLETLAELLADARAGNTRRHDPLAELLPIRANGPLPPLFCIHPVTGLAWGYAGLLRHLGQDRPIYGLQCFTAEAVRPPESLTALAAHYLGRIREVQPEGPLHLLGFSLGGLVAHEITRQIEAAGGSVAFLGMLDSYPYRQSPVDRDTIMRDEENDLVRAALAFLGLQPDTLDGDARIDDLVDHLAGVYDVAGRRTPVEIGDPDALVSRLRQVTEINLGLARAHAPGVVRADLLFVRATDRGEGAAGLYLEDSPGAWESFVTGHRDEREVECSHQRMLDHDVLETIGPWVAARLDEIDDRARRTAGR